MAYEADTLSEFERAQFRRLRDLVKGRVTRDSMVPKLEMVVGPWYVDECGNQTREITARE
jgi:hypothetical protein